jgi:predicted regulator of Ras-like GTPase activity (Roadblock/LC7/MglB family)
MPPAIGVPLKHVIARLPDALKQRVRQMDVGEAEIFIPTAKVISQIGKGSVKLSFGELRQMAPPGTFTPENDRDRMLVDLPLNEILSRLDPTMLSRRTAQRQVEVPAEVVGPFGGKNKISFSTSIMKGTTAQPVKQPAREPEPMPYSPPPPPSRPAAPAAPLKPAFQSRVQGQPTPRPAAQPAQPAAPGQPQPFVARVRTNPNAAPISPISPIKPVVPIKPAAPVKPGAPMQHPKADVPPLSFAPASPIQFTPPAPAAPKPAPKPAPLPEAPILRRTPPAPQPPRAPIQPVYSPIAPEPEPEPEYQPEDVVEPEPEPIAAPEQYSDEESFSNFPADVPISPIAPEPEPEPAPIRFNPPIEAEVPTPVPTPSSPPVQLFAGETRFLTVSLTELSQAWPEVLLKEIIVQNLSSSLVGLPFGAVEGAIKHGKIAFPWKAIRSWIKPPVSQGNSVHDTVVLELPLKIITPLFLAELKSGPAQKKVAIDDAIPNLFTGSQPLNDAPETAPPPPVVSAKPAPFSAPSKQKPTDTNYFRKEQFEAKPEAEEQHEDSTTLLRKDGTPATEFLKRYATPSEIVRKAGALPGVEGALIALPDGLLVASQIPPTMNADTIAAFLPQIFGRVTQSTRELRLGDLNNLNFTVGNVPWKIYRVGAIYFAVFGRAGEPLPTAQLVGIAAELDRKSK